MHRSYQPILPSQNKYLQQRWDAKYYDEHRRKVRDASPIVDTKAPATFVHVHLQLKKLQLEEERMATIERDNRLLLEKMSYIMRTPGQVNNRNNYTNKSLNREKRQRELERVTRENHLILYRINMRKPEYSHQKWQHDWEKNQRFMDSISAYPIDWWIKEKKTSRKQTGVKKSRDEVQDGQEKTEEERKKDEVVDKEKAENQSKENDKDNRDKEGKITKHKEEKRKKKDEKGAHKDKHKKKEKVRTKKQLEVPVEDNDE